MESLNTQHSRELGKIPVCEETQSVLHLSNQQFLGGFLSFFSTSRWHICFIFCDWNSDGNFCSISESSTSSPSYDEDIAFGNKLKREFW